MTQSREPSVAGAGGLPTVAWCSRAWPRLKRKRSTLIDRTWSFGRSAVFRQTGIKLNLPRLVLDDDVVVVTIDFDLSASFVKRGNSGKGFLFKPVLKPVALEVNGEPVALGEDDG